MDGVCTIDFEPDPLPVPDAFITAVTAWVDAFQTSAEQDGGPPDLDLVSRAQRQSLSARQHLIVQRIVYNALDRVLGFDFVAPERCPASSSSGQLAAGSLGMLRMGGNEAPAGALWAIEAAKEGVLGALKGGDPELVEAPLRNFWKQYPDFEPHHTGRCWDHGHEDYPYTDAMDCQVESMKRMLAAYLH